MSDYSPEFRPYRVAMYVTYFVFTLGFIGLTARSVWIDLYGEHSEPAAHAGTCTDQIESLKHDLDARFALPIGPYKGRNWDSFEADWNRFTRKFEDQLRQVDDRCVAQPGGAAMSLAVERMDTLRQHLARCGMESERERESVGEAIAQLHATQKSTP